MPEFDKTRIEEIVSRSKIEQWPYPKIFEALKEAGVLSYEADVASHSIVYYGHVDSYTEPVPADFLRLKPALTFDKAALHLAIRRNQTKQTDFAGFLHEIAQAGVQRYQVDMNTRTVAYLGHAGEEYIEKVPQLS
jgi:uncharacterized protein YbcV (DUF1398 family)